MQLKIPQNYFSMILFWFFGTIIMIPFNQDLCVLANFYVPWILFVSLHDQIIVWFIITCTVYQITENIKIQIGLDIFK